MKFRAIGLSAVLVVGLSVGDSFAEPVPTVFPVTVTASTLPLSVRPYTFTFALYDVPGTNTCSFHEHLEILQAIEAGEYVRAERLMDEHLLGCERQLRLGGEPRPVDLARVLGGTHEQPPARRPDVIRAGGGGT